jgi:hypothetical protein
VYGRILKVGISHPYINISAAASIAVPDDSIICYDPVIPGGMFISNLQGNASQWIYILAAPNTQVIIRGGNNSIQFSDAAFVHLEGFTIEGQTGNGLNIDDAGSFDTPTHHVRIVRCTIRNINATGNNDLLKLSGLDDFEIRNCTFLNGSQGGSGIDMVGCHRGSIFENTFTNMGSNSIQAKGGTSDIKILRNSFQNGGARALNLGGSTGLAFFRPQNATAEAERIKVIANVIEGSEAAIAFVGCRNVDVSNNTILFPRKWIIRILQETVDPTRFLPCGDNSFYNNLVVIDQNVSIEANIGPNTAPETFMFNHNLWWKTSNPSWTGPNLPGMVKNNIIADPLIIQNSKYRLSVSSPAIATGLPYNDTTLDIENQPFNVPPSLGAFEARKVISGVDNSNPELTKIYPNPVDNVLYVQIADDEKRLLMLYDMLGKAIIKLYTESAHFEIDVSSLFSGNYLLMIFDKYGAFMSTHKVIIQ